MNPDLPHPDNLKVGNAFSNSPWASLFQNDQNPPPPLCHYTDAAGLEGILRTRVIWAMHKQYLNDPREGQYGESVFRGILARRKRETEGEHRQFFEECLEEIQTSATEREIAPYCVSFSEKKDDLSQWRAYANQGAGYCLVFDGSDLLRCLKEHNEKARQRLFYLAKLRYDETEIRENLSGCIDEALTHIRNPLQSVAWNERQKGPLRRDMSMRCIQSARAISCYYKTPGFSQETEWRIFPNPNECCRNLPLGEFTRVRERNSLFAPYLEIPIGNREKVTKCEEGGEIVEVFKEGFRILREIWIGPKLDFDRAEYGIKNLLCLHKVEEGDHSVRIKRSETALR